jgi:hypothetical protein
MYPGRTWRKTRVICQRSCPLARCPACKWCGPHRKRFIYIVGRVYRELHSNGRRADHRKHRFCIARVRCGRCPAMGLCVTILKSAEYKSAPVFTLKIKVTHLQCKESHQAAQQYLCFANCIEMTSCPGIDTMRHRWYVETSGQGHESTRGNRHDISGQRVGCVPEHL